MGASLKLPKISWPLAALCRVLVPLKPAGPLYACPPHAPIHPHPPPITPLTPLPSLSPAMQRMAFAFSVPCVSRRSCSKAGPPYPPRQSPPPILVATAPGMPIVLLCV
jgi:hypothetical protein